MKISRTVIVLVVVSVAGASSVARAAAGHGGVVSIAINPRAPRILYAALDVHGVFKSSDGGAHWRASNGGLPARIDTDQPGADPGSPPGSPLRVTGLVVDPRHSNRLYAGTNCGVYKSTDAGRHWRAASEGVGFAGECTNVTALVQDPRRPSILYAGTDSSDDGHGLYKSVHAGNRWSRLEGDFSTQGISALAIDPRPHLVVYEGNRDFLPAKTVDGGLSWQPTGFFPADGFVSSLAVAADHTVYVGLEFILSPHVDSGAGVLRSIDGGATWSDVGEGLPYSSIRALAIDPITAGVLYAGTDGAGVFRSDDGGANWVPASTGLTGMYGDGTICDDQTTTLCVIVDSLAVDPKRKARLYVGTDFGLDYQIPGRIFTSQDSGVTWTETSVGLPR